MGQNFNQKREYIPPKNIIPIPQEQVNLLKKGNCNFSLYSPRMVTWKREKGDLKPDTEIISHLAQYFNSKRLSDFLSQKQEQQLAYLKSLQESGIQTFSFIAETTSPFVTGLGAGHPTETGMILDRNLGVPYIPASSIKGVLRLAHAINIANGRSEVPDSELENLFGSTDTNNSKRGQLVILDAYPIGNVQLKVDIMNPHYTNYYDGTNKQPVETESPKPIKFLTVKEGTEFVFNCAFIPLKPGDKCDEKEINAMFETAFEKIGFGGKTSIGYGRFKETTKNENLSNKQVFQKPKLEVKKLEAGEYKATVVNVDKNRQSINFELDKTKEKAVIRNCKKNDYSLYPKRTKVKIKLDGSKNNQGDYTVTEIIQKLS